MNGASASIVLRVAGQVRAGLSSRMCSHKAQLERPQGDLQPQTQKALPLTPEREGQCVTPACTPNRSSSTCREGSRTSQNPGSQTRRVLSPSEVVPAGTELKVELGDAEITASAGSPWPSAITTTGLSPDANSLRCPSMARTTAPASGRAEGALIMPAQSASLTLQRVANPLRTRMTA